MSKFLLLFSFVIIPLCSCTTLVPKGTDLIINIDEPDKIRFSGKGSGAGMMLMGAMGPMGIAIGVAIDEGIAKDIDTAAKTAGFDIETILRSHVSSLDSCGIYSLRVQRYGFSMKKGGQTLAVPEIKMGITVNPLDLSEVHSFEYADIAGDDELSAPLESLKVDGSLVIDILSQAFDKMLVSKCKIEEITP